MPPKPVKIRVLVPSVNLGFLMVQSSLIGLYTFSSTYMPSFKTHGASLHSQKPHLIYSQLQGQNGQFAVKSQNSRSTSYFWVHNHHLIKSWSWFHKNSSKIIKYAKVTIFGQQKSQLYLDQGITFSWFIRKIPSNAHFEEKDISYNSSSYFKSKKCSHKKVINFNIIGHFQKSTKRDFKSKAITWDW